MAFVIQDYETTLNNAEYPANDFKKVKAFVHGAHCEELKMLARIAHDTEYAYNNVKDIVNLADQIYIMYSKGHNASVSLIRFSLMIVELLQKFK